MELDAAERLALDWAEHHSPARVLVWGDDVRALAAEAQRRWPTATVAMYNDAVGSGVPGVHEATADEQVELVLLRLPKSLAALDDWISEIAQHVPTAIVVAAGMIKHMTLRQNQVLQRHYGQLEVSRARQKARLLIAAEALPEVPRTPAAEIELADSAGAAAGLRLVAYGGVFAAGGLDIGTRVLLDTLATRLPVRVEGNLAADLGCGSGVIAAWLARRGYRVRASDRSLAAVRSTQATAVANGLDDRIDVHWEDALSGCAPGSLELIVLNPPFHDGSVITTDPARVLFAAAAKALIPGGRLVTVWNSHLRYRADLERLVGPTDQWQRTPKFTVTVSTKPSG